MDAEILLPKLSSCEEGVTASSGASCEQRWIGVLPASLEFSKIVKEGVQSERKLCKVDERDNFIRSSELEGRDQVTRSTFTGSPDVSGHQRHTILFDGPNPSPCRKSVG